MPAPRMTHGPCRADGSTEEAHGSSCHLIKDAHICMHACVCAGARSGPGKAAHASEQAAHEPQTSTGGAVPLDPVNPGTAAPLLTQQAAGAQQLEHEHENGAANDGGDLEDGVRAGPEDVSVPHSGMHGAARHGGPAWHALHEERLRAQAGEL